MSAERLREAAAELRLEWSGDRGGAWHRTQDFHLAVADWLEDEAVGVESGNWRPCVNSALAVADAYLGGVTP